MKRALTTNKLAEKDLSSLDISLAKLIVKELEDMGVTIKEVNHGLPFIHDDKSVKFSEFPDTIIANYLHQLNIKCSSSKTPLSDEYLNLLAEEEKKGKEQAVNNPSMINNTINNPVNIDQASTVNIGRPHEQVVQFQPENVGCTILPDGRQKEALVDEEINQWYNLYNLNKTDQNTFDNLIIKLRSLIPILSKIKVGRYQIVDYTSPTDFLLQHSIEKHVQILVKGGKIFSNQK